MCGIAGSFKGSKESISRRLLLEMAGELSHRGPEGTGLFRDGNFGMVHTRLSIIDLESGQQPMCNEDRTIWVVQNGEIYNYQELRSELERRGHRFQTLSDTEAIVHAYEEWGAGCLERLNGEFAFAVFDRNSGKLFLARDRFGIRPLFYTDAGGDFTFASEVKALLRHPASERGIDPVGLVETFTFWSTSADFTSFPGIRELPPGHYMEVTSGRVGEPRCWWQMRFGAKEGSRTESVEDLAEELREVLENATRIRLQADVPVGLYLSGGLDSSAVAAMAQRFQNAPLEAFSVGFQDSRFDESSFQDDMATALGVNLNRIVVSDKDVAEVFPEVVRLAEKPMLRTSPGPLLLLSKFTKRTGFKVVLTGEGSDELLGGYQIFQEAMVRRFWARDPSSSLRPKLLGRLYPYLSRDLSSGGGFLSEFFRQGLVDVNDPLYSHRPRFRSTARNLRFLSEEVRQSAKRHGDPEERLVSRLPAGFRDFGPLGQAQYIEISTFLGGFLLSSQGDRMLMGNSVEGRFPFLDVNVAEFASRLPERLRMNGIREKYLLRRAMAPLLPPTINRRPKRPYRAPILRPFFGDQKPEFVASILDTENVARSGLFNTRAVELLVRKADAYAERGLSESDEMGVVGVLSTLLLEEQFVKRPRLAPSAEPYLEVVEGREVTNL